MAQGTVKWFDKKKGFGFIVNEKGEDVFVHYSQIEGHGFRFLKDGDSVEYDQLAGEKGLQGTRVRVVSRVPAQYDNEAESQAEQSFQTV